MTKTSKGGKSAKKLADIIEIAISNKQRVWYSDIYNEWLTQKNSTRANYTLIFDFRI